MKKILSSFLIILLTIVFIMLVSSRYAERAEWELPPPEGAYPAGYAQTVVPSPDNNISNIALAEVTPTPIPTPRPTVYKPDIDISSWEYALVNAENSIGSYAPNVEAIGNTSQYFDTRAIGALEDFLQAARDAGFAPYVNAAYRPYSAQEYIFNGKASQISWGGTYTYEDAVEMAKTIVAYPGTSEHQLGLSCDITDKYYSTMDADQMDRQLLDWLRDHCAEYGFILRYPAGKESITGWNEPWPFRYVGAEAAQFIMENNLCLEEFLALYD